MTDDAREATFVGDADDATVTKTVLAPPQFALFTGLDGARGYVQIANVPEMRAYVQYLMGN